MYVCVRVRGDTQILGVRAHTDRIRSVAMAASGELFRSEGVASGCSELCFSLLLLVLHSPCVHSARSASQQVFAF